MTRKAQVLGFGLTVVLSAAVTLLALEIFSDETPVAGASQASIHSAVLGEDREYFVHVPEGYDGDASRRYPVLFVLDGTSQSGHTAAAAALLARVGMMPPLIVIGVPSLDGDTRNRDYTPPDMRLDTDDPASPNGAADRFLAHLKTELIPQVEGTYRTARPRMLAGWSRGALFTVYSQIAAPALFDARFAHSPALWREDGLIVDQLEHFWATSAFSESFLYVSLGDAENEKMTSAFRLLESALHKRAPSNVRWKAELSVGGTHQSNPRLSTPVGLCAMFNREHACAQQASDKPDAMARSGP